LNLFLLKRLTRGSGNLPLETPSITVSNETLAVVISNFSFLKVRNQTLGLSREQRSNGVLTEDSADGFRDQWGN
jgi:hypothetical protein